MTVKPISARTREILHAYDIQLKKSLGQNFLTDEHVLRKILLAAELDPESGVLEIGPGIGALTERLAQEAKKVVAIELDQRLIPVLNELLAKIGQVVVVHGDALKADYHGLIAQHFKQCQTIHVVANLPYYITSPLLVRLLSDKLPLKNIVVMIQKEVADRLIAKPGSKNYSSLTVLVNYFATVEFVARVPRHVFIPRPEVDSAVVRFQLRNHPTVSVPDESFFFRVVRAAFAKRRKTLLNALFSEGFAHVPKEVIAAKIQSVDLNPGCRGETLTLEEFARLAQALYQIGG